MAFGLLRKKGKLRSLLDGLDNRKSHPLKDRFLRFFKRMMDEGSPLIPIPLTFNTSRPSMFPKISGNLSSLEQPDKLRVFRDIKLQIALGKLVRFLHSLRSSFVRLVKCSNNNDRSFITVKIAN